MKPAVLLLSGGLDSTAAWWVLDRPRWLHITGSAREADQSQLAAVHRMCDLCSEFADKGKGLPIDFEPFMRPGEWDFPRDLLIIMRVWALGYDSVILSWHLDDFTRDHRVIAASNYYQELLGDRGQVSYPLGHLSQAEVIRRALAMGATPEFLCESFSCVQSETHCGCFRNCTDRWVALRVAGIDDTTHYQESPLDNGAVQDLANRRGVLDWWQTEYGPLMQHLGIQLPQITYANEQQLVPVGG